MRLIRLTVQNCKSYREREEIDFHEESTILIGPNAGGKSNTLDIVTVLLRRYLLHSYVIQEGEEEGVAWRDIRRQGVFNDVAQFLDKHIDTPNDRQEIELTVRVGSVDIDNIRSILDRRGDFARVLRRYRNSPYSDLGVLDGWDVAHLEVDQEVSFRFVDGDFEASEDHAGRLFRAYLNSLHFFILLAVDLEDVDLRPTLLYFSPYRGARPVDLQANLSNDRFFNLLHQYFNATSRTETSLIKLASVYFAEKKRRLEVAARERGWEASWNELDEVREVEGYLTRIGYTWQLELVDPNRNIYEIAIEREDRKVGISKASSGEKEIFNFLFGTFALRIKEGLLIVDEPELHLHPRWQALLRELFLELARKTGNQFFLSTHSPLFITPQTIGNVRRIAKDVEGSTRVVSLRDSEEQDQRSLLHLINSHNNERLFFADEVILVEGIHDRLVFQRLIQLYSEAAAATEIVEVIEVFGKGNFGKYRKFSEALQVPVRIVADLDYALDCRPEDLSEFFEIRETGIDRNVLVNKKSKDRETLAGLLGEAIESGDLEALAQFWDYVKSRHLMLRMDLTEGEHRTLRSVLEGLKRDGIHVLEEGEIERYLPKEYRTLENTIQFVRSEAFAHWIATADDDSRVGECEQICLWALGLPKEKKQALRSEVLSRLEAESEQEVVEMADGVGERNDG